MLSKLPVWCCQALALAFLHLSCGRQKATLGSFSGAGFGLESCWGLAVSAPCRTEAGAATEAAISSIHYMVFARFCHAFEAACLVMSGIGVGLSSSFLWASEGDVRPFFGGWFLDRLGLNPAGVELFRLRAGRRHGFFTLSKLPVWWCQALALALLHLSCGRQKVTLGTFSGAGFWTGWAWILLGLSCFGSVPDGGRSCHRSCHCSSIHSSIHYMVFARVLNAFEAACLVMSGIGVGLSSSFLWASEGDVRHFFGGWFLDRLGLNPAGVGLFRLRAERRPELPPKLPLQLHPLHGFCMVFSCFRSCLSGDVRHWRWPCFIFLAGVRRRRY